MSRTLRLVCAAWILVGLVAGSASAHSRDGFHGDRSRQSFDSRSGRRWHGDHHWHRWHYWHGCYYWWWDSHRDCFYRAQPNR